MKKHRHFAVASAIGLSVLSLLHMPVASAENSTALLQYVEFVPPLDDGAPSHSRGGATRNPECDALQVLPENGSGLTTEARPMIQAYFQSGVKQVWMQVEAEDGSELYTYGDDEYFVLPEGEGFVEIPLPESMGELTLNKLYSWKLVLLCDQPFGPSSPQVSGGIRRVEPVASLAERESMSLYEKMSISAESGLWYDYISALTLMKEENPESTQLMQNWEAALRAVDLDVIFDEFEVTE